MQHLVLQINSAFFYSLHYQSKSSNWIEKSYLILQWFSKLKPIISDLAKRSHFLNSTCGQFFKHFEQNILRVIYQVSSLYDKTTQTQVTVQHGTDQTAFVMLSHIFDLNDFRKNFLNKNVMWLQMVAQKKKEIKGELRQIQIYFGKIPLHQQKVLMVSVLSNSPWLPRNLKNVQSETTKCFSVGNTNIHISTNQG